jgi:hypothetical protein
MFFGKLALQHLPPFLFALDHRILSLLVAFADPDGVEFLNNEIRFFSTNLADI